VSYKLVTPNSETEVIASPTSEAVSGTEDDEDSSEWDWEYYSQSEEETDQLPPPEE
jgi:hypothetical protein